MISMTPLDKGKLKQSYGITDLQQERLKRSGQVEQRNGKKRSKRFISYEDRLPREIDMSME